MCVSRWLRVSEASSDVGRSFVCLCCYFGLLFSGMLCDILHSISLCNSYLLFCYLVVCCVMYYIVYHYIAVICYFLFLFVQTYQKWTHTSSFWESISHYHSALFRVSCVQICICKSHATAHPRSLGSLAAGFSGRTWGSSRLPRSLA